MTDAWWNMFCYLQQENAVLKAKYNDLHKLVGEILETVKLDAKLRVDKEKKKKLKFRSKYQNKGFCREGSSCEYSHREENCQEYCSSASANTDTRTNASFGSEESAGEGLAVFIYTRVKT